MSTSVERFDERARREAARHGRTVVRRGELLRHPVYTRVLHWLVAIFFVLSLLSGFAIYSHWLVPMAWTEADSRWMRRIREYVTNEEKREPDDVGFFNGGQKLYFWAIVISGLLFLITGVFMWFDNVFPRWLVALS